MMDWLLSLSEVLVNFKAALCVIVAVVGLLGALAARWGRGAPPEP